MAEKNYPQLTLRQAQALIQAQCGDVFVRETHGKGRNSVVILPEAADELRATVGYGRHSPTNDKEQLYKGFGHFFRDGDGDLIVVSHVIELQTMNRTAVSAGVLTNGKWNAGLDFLEYHRKEFSTLEKKYNLDAWGKPVDPFLAEFGGSEFVLEGHTHPDLGAFFSSTDRENGYLAAGRPLCFFVCDPIRRQMHAGTGKNMDPARVIVYDRKTAQSKPEPDEAPLPPGAPVGLTTLAAKCLQEEACTGKLRVRKRLDGRVCVNLKLVLPRAPEKENAQEAQA